MSRFVRLCETASPTGQERAVADLVRAELEGLGLEVQEDDAAGPAGAGAGNLLVRVPAAAAADGSSPGSIMFCAHLDTVPHDDPIEVYLDDDGNYRSVGNTILGADNKAAVAVLIELAARAVAQPPPVALELLFTVAEEQGLRGAAAFRSGLESSVGFVLDHATPIGEVITVAPTHIGIEAEFKGIEAHAGLAPEQGRSAILAAVRAISEMELGRIDEATTANIGRISGGTSGNVIAGSCRLAGEVRSVEPHRVTEEIARLSDAMVWAASEAGCEVDIVTRRHFTGYRVDDDSRALGLAEAALQACGHEVRRVTTGGGSDAHVFRERGMDCLLLANGTFENHTADEWVPRDNLPAMLAVCEKIVELAGAAN